MEIRRYRNGSHQVRVNARRPFRHARRIQKLANSAAIHYSLLPVPCPDDTATVYYNYRHYEPVMGRWMARDSIEERGGINLFAFVKNKILNGFDVNGNLLNSYDLLINLIVGQLCEEYAESIMPPAKTDAFDHCFVSCETANCMLKFRPIADSMVSTFAGGILHEAWQMFWDPDNHTLEGAIADVKSNLRGLMASFKGGNCEKDCECENKKWNP